ncbi:MAG: hypothetical protein AAF696_21150, partial [Bacteroidota bacterium]
EVRDSIPLMRESDLSILVCKADKTRIQHLKQMEYTLRRFHISDLYAILLREENQHLKMLYSLIEKPLTPVGKGGRRSLFKTVFRALVLKKNPGGRNIEMPKIGRGSRRNFIWSVLKKLFRK